MPAQSTVKKDLYLQKSKSQGNQKELNNRDKTILDEWLLKVDDGSSFLLKDNMEGEKIIVLNGEKSNERLK